MHLLTFSGCFNEENKSRFLGGKRLLIRVFPKETEHMLLFRYSRI